MTYRIEMLDDGDQAPKDLTAAEFVQEMLQQGGFNTAETWTTATAIAYLSDSDLHKNGAPVDFASDVLDTGWSRTANELVFAPSADRVEITINIAATDQGASSYWARPSLRITDGDDNVVGEIDDLVMQQNGAYSGNAQLTGTIVIPQPGNTAYKFEWFDTDNRISTLVPIPSSHVAIKAFKKIEVLTA